MFIFYRSSYVIYLQAGILMGEVNMLWPEIKTQIDDPFLVMYSYTPPYTEVSVYN